MKLNKLKERKIEFENRLANLPEPSELSVSKTRDVSHIGVMSAVKAAFYIFLARTSSMEKIKQITMLRAL